MTWRRLTALTGLGLLVGACAIRAPLPPVSAPLTPTPDAAFRAGPPAPWPMTRPSLALDLDPAVLPNGLTLWLVERADVPLVSLVYANRAREYQPGRTAGLATLTAQSLLEGTVRENGAVMAGMRIGGVEPKVAITASGTLLGFSIVSSGAETAVRLIAEIVQNPALDAKALATAAADITNTVFDDDASLYGFAQTLAARALLGESHPLAIQPRDYVAALRGLDPQAVRDFHQIEYRPERSALIVVGDIDAGELRAVVEREFGSWTPPSVAPRARARVGISELDVGAPSTGIGTSRREVFALLAAGEQAYIFFPQPAVPANHPDRLALQLLSDVLAGGFSSRADQSLRHGAGLSYGVSADFRGGAKATYLQIQSAVDKDQIVAGVRRIEAVLEELRTEPVTAAELDAARTRYLSAFEVGTNESVASLLAGLFIADMPASWLDDLEVALQGIEPADLMRVATRYLRPEGDIVVLGNYYDTISDLRKLGRVVPLSRER